MLISGIQDAGSEAYCFRIRVFHVIPKDVILKEKRGGVCMFQDKVAVVTGGAGGIGKCIAEEFEKRGAKVCVDR